MASGMYTDLHIGFTIGGKKVFLSAEIPPDGSEQNQYSSLQFYGKSQSLNIKVSDLIIDLLNRIPEASVSIPMELIPDITLKDIYASYDGAIKEINFLALTTFASKEVRFIFQYRPKNEITAEESRFAFGILSDLGNLGGLPMVGPQLEDIEITDTGFIYASKTGDYNIPTLITEVVNTAYEDDYLERKMVLSDKTYTLEQNNFSIFSKMHLPFEETPFPLLLPLADSSAPSSGGGTSEKSVSIDDDTQLDDGAMWFKLGKNIGPISISRIGFSYKNGEVTLLISGSVKMAAMTISLEGLGMSFNLNKLLQRDIHWPGFQLNGLGLAYDAGAIEVSGMFLRMPDKDLEFYGSALIKTADFTISGIGSYGEDEVTKEVSFFIYAMYDGPIGGPAFFHVTGLAAGFGYNRTVRIPAIDEVRDFPLVKMALNPDPDVGLNDILADLIAKDAVPMSPDDFWLAVGVKFTSFKIIESFILLVVRFGTKVAFDILGLSILNWPGEGKTLAYIELAVKASFGPDSDVIAVEAQITPNSYIFSKDSKLRGGFAFYTWVSGEHEGDFVLSLGGYHPAFKKPAHYPDVDRLSLTWPVYPNVTIKGEMYFALTPSYMMAGGRWEVEYKISFLRAYLIVWADMIVQWQPFHYELEAGIRVGIEARIKILFVYVNFKLEMGAKLRIWGPPFAGEVYVDWSIFSFTIPFGKTAKEKPKALKWADFEKAFLPHDKQGTPQADPLDVRVAQGVIIAYKDKATEEEIIIVNPYDLVLVVDSFIPSKKMETKTEDNEHSELSPSTLLQTSGNNIYDTYADRNTDLGIRSTNISSSEFDSQTRTWVDKKTTSNEWVVQEMLHAGTAKGVADALWGKEGMFPSSNVPPESKVVKKVMTGLQLFPADPPEMPPPRVEDIDNLGYSDSGSNPALKYPPYLPSTSYEESTALKTVHDTINTLQVISERENIATDLLSIGFSIYAAADLDVITWDEDHSVLSEAPSLTKPGKNIPS